MKISISDDDGGTSPCDAGVLAARERTLQAIKVLMESDLEGWPEHLAQVAGLFRRAFECQIQH